MDMGWHRLFASKQRGLVPMSEVETRDTRNIERTWYVLFVYDQRYACFDSQAWKTKEKDLTVHLV